MWDGCFAVWVCCLDVLRSSLPAYLFVKRTKIVPLKAIVYKISVFLRAKMTSSHIVVVDVLIRRVTRTTAGNVEIDVGKEALVSKVGVPALGDYKVVVDFV